MIKQHFEFIVPILMVIFARSVIYAYLYYREISSEPKGISKSDISLMLILTGLGACYIFFLFIAAENLLRAFFRVV